MSSMKGCMRGHARVLIVKHFCPAQKQTMDPATEFLDLQVNCYFIKERVS